MHMIEIQNFLSNLDENNYEDEILKIKSSLYENLISCDLVDSFILTIIEFLRIRWKNYHIYAELFKALNDIQKKSDKKVDLINSFLQITFHPNSSNRHSNFIKTIGNFSLISELLEMGLIEIPFLIQNIKNFFYLYHNFPFYQSYVFMFFTKEIKSNDLSLFKEMREMLVTMNDPMIIFPPMFTKAFYEIINEYKSMSEEETEKIVHIKDLRPITPLCQAIINDDFDAFSQIAYSTDVQIDINSKLLFEFNVNSVFLEFFPSLIQFAAACGSLKIFKHLILSGADLQYKDENGYGIDSYAVAGGHLEIVRILSQYGIEYSSSSLAIAVQYQRNDVVDWILNFNSNTLTYNDAIQLAIQYDNLIVLNNYLQAISNEIPDISANSLGDTLIPETFYLIFEDYYDVIERRTHKKDFIYSLINRFIQKNHYVQFEYFLKTRRIPKEIKIENIIKELINNSHCFKTVLEYNLIDVKTFIYHNAPLPFTLAQNEDMLESLECVLDLWPECINLEDNSHSNSLLSTAAEAGLTQTVLELVKRGADISFQCKDDGRQPIHFAAHSISCIEILVAAGADINCVNQMSGYTPIFYAVKNKISIMDFKRFVDLGAKIDVFDNTGKSLLEFALQKKLTSIFSYIFENSDQRETILPYLKEIDNYNIFRYLIDQTCDFTFLNDRFVSSAEIILENMLNQDKIDFNLIALFLSAYGSAFDQKDLIRIQILMEKLNENDYQYLIELLPNLNYNLT